MKKPQFETITTYRKYLTTLKENPLSDPESGKIPLTILDSGIFSDSWGLKGIVKKTTGFRDSGIVYELAQRPGAKKPPQAELLKELADVFQMKYFWEDSESRKKNMEANFDDLLMYFDSCALDAMKYAKGVRESTLKDWREKLVGLKEKTLTGELICLKEKEFIIPIANLLKTYFPSAPKDTISHRLANLLNEFGVLNEKGKSITWGAIKRQWNRVKQNLL